MEWLKNLVLSISCHRLKRKIDSHQDYLKGVVNRGFGYSGKKLDLTYRRLIPNARGNWAEVFSERDLDGAHLQYIKARGLRFYKTLFHNVDAYRSDFSHSIFAYADCTQANFTGSNFEHAYLRGVDFFRANLSDCNFRGAHITECSFIGVDLSGVDFKDAHFDEAKKEFFAYLSLCFTELKELSECFKYGNLNCSRYGLYTSIPSLIARIRNVSSYSLPQTFFIEGAYVSINKLVASVAEDGNHIGVCPISNMLYWWIFEYAKVHGIEM